MLRESKHYKNSLITLNETAYTAYYSAGIGIKKIAEILQAHRKYCLSRDLSGIVILNAGESAIEGSDPQKNQTK